MQNERVFGKIQILGRAHTVTASDVARHDPAPAPHTTHERTDRLDGSYGGTRHLSPRTAAPTSS